MPKIPFGSFDQYWASYAKLSAKHNAPPLYDAVKKMFVFETFLSIMSHVHRAERLAEQAKGTITNANQSELQNDVEQEYSDNESVCSDDSVSTSGDSDEKVVQYLKGILWVMDLFMTGRCPDYYFEYTYCTAPSRKAVQQYLFKYSTEDLAKAIVLPRSNEPGLLPSVCAIMLLPPTAKSLVHSSLWPLFDTYNNLKVKTNGKASLIEYFHFRSFLKKHLL